MKRLSIVSGIILVAPLVLSACATTGNHTAKPSIDCQAPNWQALGEQDGKAGRYAYEIARHQKACPTAVIDQTVLATWEAGRQAGLKSYCTKAHAYELGQHGYSMNQVCPEEGLLEIQQSHALGYQQYHQRSRLNQDWMYPYPFGWYGPFGPYRSPYWW